MKPATFDHEGKKSVGLVLDIAGLRAAAMRPPEARVDPRHVQLLKKDIRCTTC
jgi:hypothetical protein